MKYFKVTAKCGHVGKGNYIPIDFPVRAESGKVAAKIVRYIGRVKHHKKDAILGVCEIEFTKYQQLIKENKNNPYLNCHSKQEQKFLCKNLEDFICLEESVVQTHSKQERKERIKYKLKKQKYSLSFDWAFEFEFAF